MNTNLFEISLSCLIKNLKLCLSWEDIGTLPPNIKSRIFSFLSWKCEVNDENLSFLVDRYTTTVELASCDVTAEGLKKLAACSHLQHLELGSHRCLQTVNVKPGLYPIFSHCYRLIYVNLRGCVCIDDDTIMCLAHNCQSLEVLDFSDCNLITDEALQAVADHCPSLKSLGIGNTNISDVGILYIANSKCAEILEEFNAGHCMNITERSVKVLLEKCPKLSIMTCHFLVMGDAVDDVLKEKQLSGTLRLFSCTFNL